jgi:DNA mismatch endonuclease (patch repair protein)
MSDVHTPDQRSRNMRAIKGKNSKPEMRVRSLIHRMGYRYRLHCKELPGRPDLVFPCRKKVIFVHGCFWHQHPGCRYATRPKTREAFWAEKLKENADRDRRQILELQSFGWKVLVVWECEVREETRLASTLDSFLKDAT